MSRRCAKGDGVVRDSRHDRGATAVEYALMASLIAVVVLVGIVFFGRSLSGSLDESAQAVGAAVGTSSSPPTATPSSSATPSTSATPTSTPTPTPTPTPTTTSTSGPQSVFVSQPESVQFTKAVWTPVGNGNSANHGWKCPKDLKLDGDPDVRSTSTPPGPAPDCT